MGRIWQVIEKYGKNYNSNLDENNKFIEDWLKKEEEIARLSASMKYAEINAELEEAGKKAGILKQNLEHAKAVFDKAGDNKKNFVKGYIESLEEYDKVQEAVLKRSAERFEKLKQDWNPKSDTTALSAAFNAEDMESFMAVYGDA
jgi:predicted P-loop ATPase